MSSTVATLQTKLDPKTLARSTVSDITDRGALAAKAGVDRARRNPALLAGVAIIAGLLFVRRPLANAVRRRTTIGRGKHPHRQKES